MGSIDERDMLLESDPALFHITDHYKDYPSILERRTMIDAVTLRGMLERRWRALASKKLAKEFDSKRARLLVRKKSAVVPHPASPER